MKCKNLIIITGVSCQGKTYVTFDLKNKCDKKIYSIHTDQMYLPEDGNGLQCPVGAEDEEKSAMLREYKPFLTETTIIEGSHIANQNELDIFIRELEFEGKIYKFRVEIPDEVELERRARSKYGGNYDKVWQGCKNWFKKIYNLRGVVVVESAENIINFLEIKDGCICLSGQD